MGLMRKNRGQDRAVQGRARETAEAYIDCVTRFAGCQLPAEQAFVAAFDQAADVLPSVYEAQEQAQAEGRV